jgi:hypothetical protein
MKKPEPLARPGFDVNIGTDDMTIVRKPTSLDKKVKRPSPREVSEGCVLLALEKAGVAGAADALALHVERIRPRFAQMIAAGVGPVDAQGQQLYTVCPRCKRLLRQYVHDGRGARISTGHPEDCVRCAEMGVFS